MRRAAKILGVVFACIIVALFLIAFMNPMSLLFLRPVRIENRTGETLDLIPLGRLRSSLRRPPLVVSRYFSFPRSSSGLSVSPSSTLTLIYDWDDVNFCWVLVRASGRPWKLIRSSLDDTLCPEVAPTQNEVRCCHALPSNHRFLVESLDALRDAPKPLVDAATRRD